MRQIDYSINLYEDKTPISKHSGVFPSQAYKTPQDLLQGIADFLNEEYGLDMTIVTAMKITKIDSVSTVVDLDTIKVRQERISKNKRELGFSE